MAQRLRRHRVDAVAAVEAYDCDPAFGPEALFNGDKLGQLSGSLPVIFGNRGSQMAGAPVFGVGFGCWKADRGADRDPVGVLTRDVVAVDQVDRKNLAGPVAHTGLKPW